jgi:hypothetical protein
MALHARVILAARAPMAGHWHTSNRRSPTLALLFADDTAVQVGCSMSLSFKKYKKGVFWKVVKRTAKLFVIGECIGHMQATTPHRTTGCRTLSVVEHHSQPSHTPLHCCPCNWRWIAQFCSVQQQHANSRSPNHSPKDTQSDPPLTHLLSHTCCQDW